MKKPVKAFRFFLLSLLLLAIVGIIFMSGFGSAYLLAGSGALPMGTSGPRQVVYPTATPLPDSSQASQVGETPEPTLPSTTPTLIPTPVYKNEDQETFQLFWEVWDLVQRNFYGDLPDIQAITYAAIHGMLDSLGDQYTAFIEPQAAAIISEDATGEFEGIGAFVGMNDDNILEISGVFEGGPADEAGVKAGDLVLEVDGVSIVGMSLYEAIGLIRGPAGSDVTLSIARKSVNEPFEIVVTRDRLEIPITTVEIREDGIGYLRLHEFSATARKLTEQGLAELLEENPKGIILDLRGNPGGWLDQSIEVADLFLDDGVVVIERWSDGQEKELPPSGAQPGDLGEDIPLVVLVNGSTASAAEIVAGALQDRERAILIGETTFGKGSVQRPFTLSDGSELRVTIARWFTPNDRAIQGQGLEPDIEVPWPEDVAEGEDPQLEQAVEYLLSGD
ncbi:MAG TPA: S41 family peptidase [Chloroflexi bacterium]|nr:S41 family peptidase [Chloroflexota bacterium]